MRLLCLSLALLLASGAGPFATAQHTRSPETEKEAAKAGVASPEKTVRWMKPGGEPVTEIDGYRVAGYRDAGEGGLDWTLIGEGDHAGWGTRQLWMGTAPLAARTELDIESEAVAFMMDGDGNDGFATFLVDGNEVGTWDMYNRSNATLVVTGLPLARHVLEVRVTGQKRSHSNAAHVTMYGGSALVRDVVAAR